MASKQPLHPAVIEHYREMGKKGGAARAKKLSARRLRQIALLGNKASIRARRKKRKMEEDRWTWEEGG